jgi:molybdenum cofactor cytidylyltransferase
MQFGPIPLMQAEGKILAHNLAGTDGKRLLHKGKLLSAADLDLLHNYGCEEVYVAWLDPDDVDENVAAQRTGEAVSGTHLEMSRATAGRVNLKAAALGVLRIDTARLDAINQCDGITIATLRANSVVTPRKIVATIKIIPYGVPESDVQSVVDRAAAGQPVIRIDALTPRTVGLVLHGSPGLHQRLAADFMPLQDRITALGSQVTAPDFVALGSPGVEQRLADSLQHMCRAGASLIILAGETAVMHRNDMLPRAVERAGGSIECVGAPVEPGNLMMLAYLGNVPVLSAPGCARNPRDNVVDHVIPRLLTGERLTRSDIIAMAHGGLLGG